MDPYESIINTIARQTSTKFRGARWWRLWALRKLKVPDAVLNFYKKYEPKGVAAGQVRLWPIADIVVENTRGVPGVCVQPHGYVVFASTFCGDAYCFNCNKLDAQGEPEIILVSHEMVREGASAEQVRPYIKTVAPNLLEFLRDFTLGEIDEKCIY